MVTVWNREQSFGFVCLRALVVRSQPDVGYWAGLACEVLGEINTRTRKH
jgi:hypothetical protein